jgi:hypothetical protein
VHTAARYAFDLAVLLGVAVVVLLVWGLLAGRSSARIALMTGTVAFAALASAFARYVFTIG